MDLRRGSINTGMGFVLVIMTTITALGAMMVGSVTPLMKHKINQPVIVVTNTPEKPKGNLQLYTFYGITLTPSPKIYLLPQPQERGGFNYGSPPSSGGSSSPSGGGGGGGGGGSAI